MEKTEKEKKDINFYEERLKPTIEKKNYDKAYKILNASPNLAGYLTKAEAVEVIEYLLKKNNKVITKIKSSLEKTLDLLEKN